MVQNKEQVEENKEETKGSSKAGTTQSASADQDKAALLALLRETAAEKTIECAAFWSGLLPVRPSIAPSNRMTWVDCYPKRSNSMPESPCSTGFSGLRRNMGC
jgi:hypothetical protein